MTYSFVSAYARSLRGGGGGGGGGGYSGGTGTYGSSDCGDDCSTFSLSEWVWVGIGAASSVIYGCYYYYRYKKMKSAEMDTELDFDVAVSEAKRNIVNTSNYSSIPKYQTYEGTFDSKYADRGKTLDAVLTLRLVNDGVHGYVIEGKGEDKDGETKVTEGFVTYDGNAWWLEETLSRGNSGLKVLSQGTFDLAANTFTGTWKSSSRYYGNYVSFVGKDVKKAIAPDVEEAGINDFRAKLEMELSQVAKVY